MDDLTTVAPAPGFLELVSGTLFRPAATFAAAARRPPVGAALLVVGLVSALGALAGGGGPIALLRAAAGFAGTVAWLAVCAALLGFVAELVGGTGRMGTLFTLLALARAPGLLLLPLAVAGKAWPAVAPAAGAIGLLWGLVLTGVAIWAAYRVSGAQAGMALFVALGAAVFVPLVLLVLGLVAAISQPELWQTLQQLPTP